MSDTAKIILRVEADSGYESTEEFPKVTVEQYGDVIEVLRSNVDVAKMQAAVQAMDQLFHAATNMYLDLAHRNLLTPADRVSRRKVLDEAEAAMRALGMIYEEDENTEAA